MRNFTFTALALTSLSLGCSPSDAITLEDSDACQQDAGDTSAVPVCTDPTGCYDLGDSWTCQDDCNTCTCVEPDVIASTNVSCAGAAVR